MRELTEQRPDYSLTPYLSALSKTSAWTAPPSPLDALVSHTGLTGYGLSSASTPSRRQPPRQRINANNRAPNNKAALSNSHRATVKYFTASWIIKTELII